MKIVLFSLNASFVHTNLAIRALAEPLRRDGFDVVLLEFTGKDRRDTVLEALVCENADIYGFSTYIWNRREMLFLSADLRSLRPNCRIIFGGPEVSFDGKELIAENPQIDHLIRGEGEEALLRLCRRIYRKEDTETIIDGGEFSGFYDAGVLYDSLPQGKILYYESSRGCPFRCAYCLSSLSGGVRAKSAEVTLSEMHALESEAYGATLVKFVDRTFNFDKKRARAIWRGLAGDEFTKKYHFEICASLLEEEDFAILGAMPPGRIQLEAGVQSTNPTTLRAINRSPETARVIENIRRLRSLGNIHIHADLIAGLPHEDMTSFARSFDRLYGACDMLQLGFLKLLRGSSLRDSADALGYKFSNEPPYTVLSSDSLSFDDIMTLRRIESALERFANSGAFAHSIDYIVSLADSPFVLFRELSELCEGSCEKMGQRDAALALSRLAEKRGVRTPMFVNLLRFDWTLRENAPPPRPLLDFMPEFDHALPPKLKREAGGNITEVVPFDFGCGVEYHAIYRSCGKSRRIL